MPVVRNNLAQSSILRKLIGYGATHRGGLHTAMYGLPNFRVLTGRPAQSASHTMITTAISDTLPGSYPPGLFLFADPAAYSRPRIFSIMDGRTARVSDTV